MSKKQSRAATDVKTNSSDTISTAPVKPAVPGRTVGFVIMSVLTVFVAVFMQVQSRNLDNTDTSAAYTEELEGFRSDLWYLPDDELLGFVAIPAGSFTMGSNPALDRMAYENERWSRTQRQGQPLLPLYYIAKFETTRAQFAAFVADTGMAQQAVANSETLPGGLPVTQVNWPDALAYTRWLDEQLRASPDTPAELKAFLESGARVTLPNEAEWEKAARGEDGRVFPWGSLPNTNMANIASNRPLPVGSIECDECAYGLSDMSGNVWELTRSVLKDYPFSDEIDRDNLDAEQLYVMRGGSYSDQANNARAAVRGAVDPGVRNDTIGFRVVISTH
jgi:serine/threonine-protein kinase